MDVGAEFDFVLTKNGGHVVEPLPSFLVALRRKIEVSAKRRNSVDRNLRSETIGRQRIVIAICELKPKLIHQARSKEMRFAENSRVILDGVVRSAGRGLQSAGSSTDRVDIGKRQPSE